MDRAEPIASSAVDTVVRRIDRDRLTRTLVELIGIPSVNPFDGAAGSGDGEGAVARYLAGRLTKLGWTCEVTEYARGRFNVIGRSGVRRPGRSLMLAGHTDTVEATGYADAFAGKVHGGRVHGRGACDMKAALACYVELAEVLAAEGVSLDGELIVAGVGDEEYRQTGAKAVRAAGLRADAVIIGEPTELTACHATKGLAAYDLTVTGTATHGSVPQHGSNAILAAAELLREFPRYVRHLERSRHRLLGSATANVGVITGGQKPNIVPAECRVEISRRLLPGETPAGARDGLAAVLGRSDVTGWQLSDAWWSVDPYELPDGHPLGRRSRGRYGPQVAPTPDRVGSRLARTPPTSTLRSCCSARARWRRRTASTSGSRSTTWPRRRRSISAPP